MDTKPTRRLLLVVDKDPAFTQPLVELLVAGGFAASAMSAADDALEVARAEHPALALIGVHPPSDSAGFVLGARLCLELDVPFIVLARSDDAETARRAAESHALGYLLKGGGMQHCLPTINLALPLIDEVRQLKMRAMNLTKVLEQGREVSIATGVLMNRSGLNRQQAFERLRALARRQRRRLHDVAAQLIESEEWINGVATAVQCDDQSSGS
jgi:response regulator NasT